MGRLIAATLVSAGVLLGSVPTVLAAGPSFGTPSAEASFGKNVTFTQPVGLDEAIASAEILVTFPGSVGPTVIDVKSPLGTGQRTLSYPFDLADGGFLAPNSKLSAQWRLHLASAPDVAITGPSVSVLYADDRFDWKTRASDLVRVHWYEGTEAFGTRALRIAEDAVASSSALLGVTESEPIDFYVYADQAPFYDAMPPSIPENVGGKAYPDTRTMLALIGPNQIGSSWVNVVIPHELTHLVFDTAVKNPYHVPLNWLDEGLADYVSLGYDASYRAMVQEAAASGELIPLDGLADRFPPSESRFRLSYAESTGAVDYLVRTYGQDALVSLVRSYATGLTDDEAFTKALGIDATAFGDAWLASVGAVAPPRYGPKPAAPGPVPAAWAGNPVPGATGAPAAPGAPAAAPSSGPGAALVPSNTGDESTGAVLLLVVSGVTIAGVLALYGWRRRQDAAEA